MDRVLSLGRNMSLKHNPSVWSSSSKLQPLMSRQQSKNARFHTDAGIHPTDCPWSDRFDHRLMIDRGDFLKDCGNFLKTVGRLARALLSVLSNCKQRTFWQAAALTAHTHKHVCVCVCTTKCTEGIAKSDLHATAPKLCFYFAVTTVSTKEITYWSKLLHN